ncbi:MAG: hypothetical protein ACJ788_03940 [Ktedonobacteraceae bacterium]
MADERIWERLQPMVRRVQIGAILIAGVLITLWVVPVIRRWLISRSIFDQDSVIAVIGLAMILIFGAMAEVHKSSRTLMRMLEELLIRNRSGFIAGGGPAVAERLSGIVDSIKLPRDKKVDILGMTLDVAWPQLEQWLRREDIYGWHVTLYGISPDFAERYADWLGEEVVKSARNLSTSIQRYIHTHMTELKMKNIKLSIVLYQTFPPVQGIMLGNRVLFISTSHWGLSGRPCSSIGEIYEFFSADDNSPRARAYRLLFRRWIEAVTNVVSEPKLG